MTLPQVRDPAWSPFDGADPSRTPTTSYSLWAATCAEHVLPLFEQAVPGDRRPRQAIDAARAWARGELPMMRTRVLGGHAMGAARPFVARPGSPLTPPGRPPVSPMSLSTTSQPPPTKAAQAAGPPADRVQVRRLECSWQRDQLPARVRGLVVEDQQRRNEICWSVVDQ